MATRQVSPGSSVAAAINSSAPGDAVMLRGGGTHGGFRVEKPGVRIYGENPDVEVSGHVYVTSVADETEIDHLVLLNGGNTGRTNPTVDATDLHLHHCVVDNQNKSIALHLGGNATSLAASRALIEHNVFRNVGRKPWTNYDHAIYLKWADDAIIRHNQFLNGGDYAVHFWGGWSRRTQVYNNYADGTWAGFTIMGGNSAGGSDDAEYYKNIVTGPPRSGRQVFYGYTSGWTGSKSMVRENLLVGNGPHLMAAGNPFYDFSANLTGDPRIVNGKITNPAFLGFGPGSMQSGPTPPPDPDPPEEEPGDCTEVRAQLEAARVQIDNLEGELADAARESSADKAALEQIRIAAAGRL